MDPKKVEAVRNWPAPKYPTAFPSTSLTVFSLSPFFTFHPSFSTTAGSMKDVVALVSSSRRKHIRSAEVEDPLAGAVAVMARREWNSTYSESFLLFKLIGTRLVESSETSSNSS
nr:hypothetical protein L203_04189 [Cryptococcus depauperatus CBS 7841]